MGSGFTCFIFFSTIFTTLLPPSLSLSFALQNNFTLYGDSYFTRDSISLTQQLHTSLGRALYTDPLRFLDPSTNSTASFSCKFSFSITPTPFNGKPGDGLAFLITSNSTSLSTSPGYMALPSLTTGNTQDSFVAVEFDTSFDPDLGDINDNHIGLDVNTVVSLASVGGKSIGIDLRSGRVITSWIEYEDRTKMMRIWVSYSPFKPTDPVISTHVDLSGNVLKEFMHVGFSASNGRKGSAHHVVESWQFRTYGFMNSGIGQELADDDDDECLSSICIPEDDDFVAQYRFVHPGRRVSKLEKAFIGLGSGAAVLLVSAVAMAFWIRWKKRFVGRRRGSGTRRLRQVLPARFSLAEVRSATRGFHRSKVIGEGASGVVYEGTLGSGKEVAVKRFTGMSHSNPFVNPFTNELAAMAGSLKHKNLVQLIGWCCEGNELVLVYEYMANGSLDKILHWTGSTTPTVLTWEQRRKILLGVASALVYLHEECEIQIIHRDVKACNIMLDAEFNAKLGDFGLAELYDRGATIRDATIPAGTVGYLAPEYVHSGVPTEKTDVYSFGVVVLEVATGRQPVDTHRNVLVDKVWGMWAKGKLMDLVDPRLMGRFDRVQMESMLMVGLACVHPDCRKRPTMKEAERMLRGEIAVPVLPSRRPTIRLVAPLTPGAEDIQQGDRYGSTNTPWSTPLTHFG